MQLAFREYGAGQPLIILHGLFGQSDNWNTIAKQFAERGFHVFAVDQRNHGLSPHSETWDYESMAGDLKEFIDHHGLNGPILLGHSMGAKTVMYFENLYPGIASRMIIADMAARAYEPQHQDVLKALHAVDFNKVTNRKEAEAIMSEYLIDFVTRQFLLKNIYWKDGANKKMDWRFNLKTITREYENVRVAVPFYKSEVPALVIRGGKSNYVNANDLEELKSRYPKMEVVTIEDAGHWVHAEKPKEFLEAVLAFIKG
jgi:pimeloyl-ACP methyl ester carboxylesterase